MDDGESNHATYARANPEALQAATAPTPGEDRVTVDGVLRIVSRRTLRQRRRQQARGACIRLVDAKSIFHLPYELLVGIFSHLRPRDLVAVSCTCSSLREFVLEQQVVLADSITRWRYSCLEKCLRPPMLLRDVDERLHPHLQSVERQEMLAIHKKPYQHVQPPDPALVCTCLTCILRWNSLCLAVDFAHWQDHLDDGEPIPVIPRGRQPGWNQRLVAHNAIVVARALQQPLWYACILQMHLESTVRSIRRHSLNKGNKRRRFLMTRADEAAETDAFLERSGPPTLDFPFHRDNYYMLEAFLPNRGWDGSQGRWMYLPAEQHDIDLQLIARRMQARIPPAATERR